MLTEERLVSRSAAVLFLGAGAATIVNSLAAVTWHTGPAVDIRALRFFGIVSLLSGGVVWWRAPALTGPGRLAVAVWGLLLLIGAAAIGRSVVTTEAAAAVPVFVMVILVWLGLTSARGTALAFAPVTIAAAAYISYGIDDSRVVFASSLLVIVVSTLVAETIGWAMSELRRREALLAVQATTDPLTGLLNRSAFADELEASCARAEQLVLAFVDLNGFKDVNDTFGHQVGDEVLVECARRLTDVVRDHDVVARFGGDEFVVLFRRIDPGVSANDLLERIRTAIGSPLPAIAPAAISASVGVVDDRDGSKSPDELLRAADTAMYSRKHGITGASSPARLTSRSLVHHRRAMDGLGGGFTVLQRVETAGSHDWRIVEANTRIREVYGPLGGDPVGMLLSELDRFADNSALASMYSAALETSTRQETEYALTLPDGGEYWRHIDAIPVDDGVVAVLTADITASKLAERALADAEERSRTIVEGAADAIITVDADARVCSFNRAAETMFRMPRATAIGRSYLPFVPESALGHLRDAFASGTEGERFEVTLARGDGEDFDAQVAISQLETAAGTFFTAIVRDVTEQRQAAAALRTALECDELTGRPNLRSMLTMIETAAAAAGETGTAVGLLSIDLDRFTLVNDSLGQELGDEFLVMVADRIAGAVRDTDTVARVSGDHFVVLTERIDSEAALLALATRIQDALRNPFHLGREREVFATASIGAVVWSGTELPRELLRYARTAMHRAKARGPSGIQLFDDAMPAASASRLEDEMALRRAVERDELCAYYQPIVALDDARIAYVEALVRWNRPGIGLVPPDAFIPMAEETDLVVDIGTWMLRRALTDCATWQAEAPGVGVSVNVSARQFHVGDLAGTLHAAIAAAGLPPELVVLEITESVMLEHSDWNVAVLEHIRATGVRIALDDFGTGYSALTHLRRLPIDTIKIDRSFLQQIETEADLPTIRAIVALADAHHLDVVAEGIETDVTCELVRRAGCRQGQGFLFARPAPYDVTVARLRADAASVERAGG